LLAEVTYVIQESQIGDWELAIKNFIPSEKAFTPHQSTHPLGRSLSMSISPGGRLLSSGGRSSELQAQANVKQTADPEN
jgi:hypothetical protein